MALRVPSSILIVRSCFELPGQSAFFELWRSGGAFRTKVQRPPTSLERP
jgi:hypothetical protein